MRRRHFLQRLGAVAGNGAVYAAMKSLGLIATAQAAQLPSFPPDVGRGKRVIVLGAGIAGLVTAYELERAGFAVELLEARDRVGGRTWTLRKGSAIDLIGEATQQVGFADGLYMDAGPSRIPNDHTRLLSYCRTLEVPLEIEVNASRSGYVWAPDLNHGKPVQLRQAINDIRGYLSELLAKAVDQDALNSELSVTDKERLAPFLRVYGDLGPDSAFRGTERSGLAARADPSGKYRARDPLPLKDLLSSPEIIAVVYEDDLEMQAPLLQPVGGMDRIALAFEAAIRSPIHKNMDVVEIHRADQGAGAQVTIGTRDRLTRAARAFTADYAVVALPPFVFGDIRTNLGADVIAAIASFKRDAANKIGFEAPRFWEAEGIYGGISFLAGETGMILYPSAGLNQARGLLLACYNRGAAGRAFAAKTIADQIAAARLGVDRVHPGHGGDLINPAVVNWTKIPYSLSPWPDWGVRARSGHLDSPALTVLRDQSGPVLFAGAHLTQMPAWQEGAVESAHTVVTKLVTQVSR